MGVLLAIGGVVLGTTGSRIRSLGKWCYELAGGLLGTLPDNVERHVRHFFQGEAGRLLFGGFALAGTLVVVSRQLLIGVERRCDRVARARLLSTDARLHWFGWVTKASGAVVVGAAAVVIDALRWHVPLTCTAQVGLGLALAAAVAGVASLLYQEIVQAANDLSPRGPGTVFKAILEDEPNGSTPS